MNPDPDRRQPEVPVLPVPVAGRMKGLNCSGRTGVLLLRMYWYQPVMLMLELHEYENRFL
ncbi:hypothetical protein D9M68_713990 [compost metagenome]